MSGGDRMWQEANCDPTNGLPKPTNRILVRCIACLAWEESSLDLWFVGLGQVGVAEWRQPGRRDDSLWVMLGQ